MIVFVESDLDRYQRFSKEWNQVARIRSVKAKTFKEAADVLSTFAFNNHSSI